jgi:hypothetical protein
VKRKKREGKAFTSAAVPTATAGEVLDGAMIELIRDAASESLRLLLCCGAKETVGSLVEFAGRFYEPLTMSLVREMALPTHTSPHGSTRRLLAEICKLVKNFADLPERSASLVGRFVLCTWLVEAFQVAPALVLVGPDIMRGNQLVALLHSICRHALRMTGLTPGGLRSMPSGARFTFLISQPTIGAKLERLLRDASRRDQKIPHRSGLLDLFGAQVLHVEAIPLAGTLSPRSIQIPMIPGGAELPVLDSDTQCRITTDFQAKLLSFRRAKLATATTLQFDSSKFVFALRELAHSIVAATPDDAGLQTEVFELLREENEEIRAERWVESSTVAVESVLVACHESPGGDIYVRELSEIAQEILRRRGEERVVDPGAFGKTLKLLGFTTEPRDAKGMKFVLTESVCSRAHQLARDFGVPEVESEERWKGAASGREN